MRNSLEELDRKLRNLRDIGEIWVAEVGRRGLDDAEALDALTLPLGLVVQRDSLSRIPRDVAADVIATFLARSLAWMRYDAMSRGEAESTARDFVAHFAENAAFMTNIDPATHPPSATVGWGWSPLSRSTFDAFVLGLDADWCGLIGVAEDD